MEARYCVPPGTVKLVSFFVTGFSCKADRRARTLEAKFYDFIIRHFEFPCGRVTNFEHLLIC